MLNTLQVRDIVASCSGRCLATAQKIKDCRKCRNLCYTYVETLFYRHKMGPSRMVEYRRHRRARHLKENITGCEVDLLIGSLTARAKQLATEAETVCHPHQFPIGSHASTS